MSFLVDHPRVHSHEVLSRSVRRLRKALDDEGVETVDCVACGDVRVQANKAAAPDTWMVCDNYMCIRMACGACVEMYTGTVARWMNPRVISGIAVRVAITQKTLASIRVMSKLSAAFSALLRATHAARQRSRLRRRILRERRQLTLWRRRPRDAQSTSSRLRCLRPSKTYGKRGRR